MMINPDTAQYHSENCVEITAYLLKSGVSLYAGEVTTLLLEACHYGNLNAVKLVVENHQIDVNGEFYTYLIVLIVNFSIILCITIPNFVQTTQLCG